MQAGQGFVTVARFAGCVAGGIFLLLVCCWWLGAGAAAGAIFRAEGCFCCGPGVKGDDLLQKVFGSRILGRQMISGKNR